jgi:hypothetical protein
VSAISGGYYHTAALKSDGTVWTWGRNNYGQLGNNSYTDSSTAVEVVGQDGSGTLSDIKAIAGGSYHTVALKSDGTVWAWGRNASGQLGNGTTTDISTPVEVVLADQTPLGNIIAIAAADDYTIALKSDGNIWAWGNNASGQLGDGTTNNRLNPVKVDHIDGVTSIAGVGGHTIALAEDPVPTSTIADPLNSTVLTGTSYAITGTANDCVGSGVQQVEVSTTDGQTWNLATGTNAWSYFWSLPMNGSYTIKSRATDNSGNVETPNTGVTVTISN